MSESLIEQGHQFIDSGQYLEALAAFEQACEQEPGNPEGWYGQGLALYRLERYSESIASLNQALQLRETYGLAIVWRGLAYQQLKQSELAQADFKRVIEIEAKNAKDWQARGIAFDELGRKEEAITAFDQAIAINADYYQAWNNRGISLYRLGRYEEALASFNKAVTIRVDNHATWFYRGSSLHSLGRDEEAIAAYDKAITLKADFHEVWYNRGISLYKLGRDEEAIAAYDKAITLKADFHEVWYNRGLLLYKLGRDEEAIAAYDKAITLKADFHDAWFYRGILLHDLGRDEEAVSSYDQAIAINVDDYTAWNNRGISLHDLGRDEEAVSSYDQAIAINADYDSAWNNRGNSLHSLGLYEEAVSSYDQAIAINADNHEAWYNRGNLLHSLGLYKEAITSYDRAIAIKADYYDAWIHQGLSLNGLSLYGEAISSYDQAIALKPDGYTAWNNQGNSLYRLGDYKKAVTSYDQALHLTQGQLAPAWLGRGTALLKWYWLEHRDYKPAIDNYNQGIRSLDPNHPNYSFNCGTLYQEKADVLYQYAAQSSNPFPDWLEAKQCYFKAQELLSLEQYPEQHLQIWQDLVKVCFALGNQQAVELVLQEGAAKLARHLNNPELNLGSKITLERRFVGFEQLRVDALAPSNPTAAWELAEQSKNRALWRLRHGWGEQIPDLSYQQVQSFLPPRTAVVYWYLSAAALTTFILKPGQPPLVMAPTPPKRSTPLEPSQPDYPPALHQLRRLEQCLQQWKQTYQAFDPETGENFLWPEKLPYLLFNQLRNILEVNRMVKEYLTDVDQLILVPHRDLHLLPLHTLFPGRFALAYLPSLQLGLEIQQSVLPLPDVNALLSVEDPPSDFVKVKAGNSSKMLFAELESAIIAKLYDTHSITGTDATRQQVMQALQSRTGCFHFTGHAYHNLEYPLQSALALAGEELLTLEDLFQLNLKPYHLVCLSACETGLTSAVDITDEYVGLVSGFLKSGISYVVSTLWLVDEVATALFSIQLHQELRHPPYPSAVVAFKQAQEWLKAVTWKGLEEWYEELGRWYLERNGGVVDGTYETIQDAARHARVQAGVGGENHQPFEHPQYWAGFIITGNL